MNHSPFFNQEIKNAIQQQVNGWTENLFEYTPDTPQYAQSQRQMSEFFSQSFSAIESLFEKQKELLVYIEKNNQLILKEEESAANILKALQLDISTQKDSTSTVATLTSEIRILTEKKEKISNFFINEKDNALILDSALYALDILHRQTQETHIKLKPLDFTKSIFVKDKILPQIFKMETIFKRLEKVYLQLTHTLITHQNELDTLIKEEETKVLLHKLAQPF